MTHPEAPVGAQVVLRTIRILKSFTVERPEWHPSEMAEALGLAKTTTHRLLQALASQGLVVRRASGGYRLGPAAIALGAQALRTNDLRELVHPILVELATDTGETASLEVLDDGQILIVDEVSGTHLIAAMAEIGNRWPLHATSTGKAILAHLPTARRSELLTDPLERFTPRTVTRKKALEAELDKVRERGFAEVVEELEAGYAAVGAAFVGPLGEVTAAVSLGGPASRLDAKRRQELGERLRQTARRLSRHLGHA